MNKWWIVSRDTIIFIWLSWAHCSSYNSQINSFRYRCSTESVQTFWSNVGLFRVTITDPKSENHAPTWISSTALLPPMFHYPHSQLPPLTFWGGVKVLYRGLPKKVISYQPQRPKDDQVKLFLKVLYEHKDLKAEVLIRKARYRHLATASLDILKAKSIKSMIAALPYDIYLLAWECL